MGHLKVVRPREVEIYECDGPECHRTCDGAVPSWSSEIPDAIDSYRPNGCSWVMIPARCDGNWYDHPHERLFFCGYRCVANWAYVRACTRGELNCAEEMVAA